MLLAQGHNATEHYGLQCNYVFTPSQYILHSNFRGKKKSKMKGSHISLTQPALFLSELKTRVCIYIYGSCDYSKVALALKCWLSLLRSLHKNLFLMPLPQ